MNAVRQETEYSWHIPRLVTAWVIALVLAVLIVLLVPTARYDEWLVVGIGAVAVLSFVLQLGTAQREGFITRIAFSSVGSALIFAAVWGCALLFN